MFTRSCQLAISLLDGRVLDIRVAGGHLDRLVVEHPLDHWQRHAVVDHARAEVMAEPVRVNAARQPPVAVADLRPAHVALDQLADGAHIEMLLAADLTAVTTLA